MSRVATFSSSSNHNLVGLGSRKMTDKEKNEWLKNNPKSKKKNINHIDTPDSKFYTYVGEKVMEKQLGRSLTSENSARPTAWGTLVEEHAFSKMGLEYSLVSKERFYKGDYWSGMPDLLTDEIVGDIKCPWTLKAFCELVNSMNKGWEAFKEDHPKYYWQLVSNSILCKRDKAMIVCYAPYKEDLEDIRQLAEDHMGDLNNRFSFIQWAEDEELPYLIEGNKYNDINVMEFDIPQEDKDILTARVEMAIVELKKQI